MINYVELYHDLYLKRITLRDKIKDNLYEFYGIIYLTGNTNRLYAISFRFNEPSKEIAYFDNNFTKFLNDLKIVSMSRRSNDERDGFRLEVIIKENDYEKLLVYCKMIGSYKERKN